jgi:tetratricopeptide (TPR) repeat protein
MIKFFFHIIIVINIFFSENLFAGIFDTLQLVSKEKRSDVAENIIHKKLFSLDSKIAFSELNKLNDIALKDKNIEMRTLVLFYKGEYQFRNLSNIELALSLMKESLIIADKSGLKKRASLINHGIGMIYYNAQNYPLAFEYLIRADNLMKSIGYEKIPDIAVRLKDIGRAYSGFKNFNKGIYYYKLALNYAEDYERIKSNLFNNLGTNYREKMMLDSAIHYYQKALALATENKDSLAIGITTANMGDLYLLKGDLALAKINLDKGYELCKKYELWQGVGRILLTSIDVDLQQNNIQDAKKKLEETEYLINSGKTNDELTRSEYLKSFAKIYKKENKINEAFNYLEAYIEAKDSLYLQKDISMLANLEAQQMTEKHLTEMQIKEKEKELQKVIRNIIIVVAILILLIAVKIILNLRAKQKREKQIVELQKKEVEFEKTKVETELKNARRMLQSFMENIREKNRLIENFSNEVDKLKAFNEPEVEKHKHFIAEKLSEAKILTENDWIKFRKMFDEVHEGFFHRLNMKYENLTQGELRFLALIKLEMSTDEISAMTGVSPHAVRRTSQRLRRKLNIVNIEELLELVENV